MCLVQDISSLWWRRWRKRKKSLAVRSARFAMLATLTKFPRKPRKRRRPRKPPRRNPLPPKNNGFESHHPRPHRHRKGGTPEGRPHVYAPGRKRRDEDR